MKTEAPSRSSEGRLWPVAVFGQVASPAGSARDDSGIEMLIVDGFAPVGARSDGPEISLANSTKGPAFDELVRGFAARPLLLSMNTTPTRPVWSTPRSIMSRSERSPVQVVPDVQTCPRWSMRWLTFPETTVVVVPARASARASVTIAAYVFQCA